MATPSRRSRMIKTFMKIQAREKKKSIKKENKENKTNEEGLKKIQELWLKRQESRRL